MPREVRAPSRGKNVIIFLFVMLSHGVIVLQLTKIVRICHFVLTAARNLSLLEQFKYISLKVLITVIPEHDTIYKVLSYSSQNNED